MFGDFQWNFRETYKVLHDRRYLVSNVASHGLKVEEMQNTLLLKLKGKCEFNGIDPSYHSRGLYLLVCTEETGTYPASIDYG
jgi:hypothetical protein